METKETSENPEIEITEDMIQAGDEILYSLMPEEAYYSLGDRGRRAVLIEVYQAMSIQKAACNAA